MTRTEYELWGAKATAVKGEDLPHSQLNREKVLAIRENRRGLTAKQLAAEFGVHYRTVEKVRHRETWSHIK